MTTWSELSQETRKRLVAETRERAESGACFLCEMIISRRHPKHSDGRDTFPEKNRFRHMMLEGGIKMEESDDA